jgi:hypothetical protein
MLVLRYGDTVTVVRHITAWLSEREILNVRMLSYTRAHIEAAHIRAMAAQSTTGHPLRR